MRRFLLLLVLGAAAALLLWYGLRRSRLGEASGASVASLLPKETLAFIHLPDLNGTRAKWRETDIYKLWSEPAVQEFLQKPLSKMSKAGAAQQKLRELEALEVKDAFLALTSWENNQARLLSGFRFKGSAEKAEKVIGEWRAGLQQKSSVVQRETISHQQHRIEVVTEGVITIATVYEGNWFFAANDVAALETLLDRADGRLKDERSTLAADENFTAAIKRMPGNYAILAYGRPDQYFTKFSTQTQSAAEDEQLGILRQIRSITAASRIENGKFRDVLFAAMPKNAKTGDLTRASLSLASNDSFLYSAGFLKFPGRVLVPGAEAANGSALAGTLHRMVNALSAAGLTREDWNNAFGSEFGIIADWKENARWPSFSATLPVKDGAKARGIMGAIATATAESGAWVQSEKDGVQYYSKPPVSPMLPIAPTVALSDRLFIVAQDPDFAEAIVKRSSSGRSQLAASAGFKAAERLVTEPKHGFSYLDSELLYNRLDAAVRPMLVMAAAFMPRISDTVELGKVPAAEVVTKHLSRMVMSQRYETDGYLTEAVGPVSIYQAAFVIGALTGAGAKLYQNPPPSGMSSSPFAPAAPSLPTTPAALPTATATETP